MGLFQLVYKSQAAEDISYSDILHILRTSRTANSLQEITGILIFREGHFLQLLEGQEEVVRHLVEQILEDPRHQKCKVLFENTTDERIFPEFSMAYFDGDLSTKGVLEVDTILEISRQGSKVPTQMVECFKVLKKSVPQLNT